MGSEDVRGSAEVVAELFSAEPDEMPAELTEQVRQTEEAFDEWAQVVPPEVVEEAQTDGFDLESLTRW